MQGGRDQQVAQGGVLGHVAEPLLRELRVQRHVGGAAAQDAQHRDQHVQAARHVDAEQVAAADAAACQRQRHGPRAPFQRGIVQRLAGAFGGDAPRRAFRLRRDQRRQPQAAVVVARGVVPFLEHLGAPGGVEQGQLGKLQRRRIARIREGFQQGGVMAQPALQRGGVEAGGRAVEIDGQRIAFQRHARLQLTRQRDAAAVLHVVA